MPLSVVMDAMCFPCVARWAANVSRGRQDVKRTVLHFAQGSDLTPKTADGEPGKWSDIGAGSLAEIIFNRVCPSG